VKDESRRTELADGVFFTRACFITHHMTSSRDRAIVRLRCRARPVKPRRASVSAVSTFLFGVRVVRYFIPAKSRPQRPNRGNARVTDRQRDSSRAVECENAVKSRSFSVCFPGARSTTRVLRTARARTVRTLLTERVSHRTPLSPLRRALERHARARAPHASRPYSANPRTTDPARTSSHAMPAVSKAGAGAPKRAAAAPAIVEDPSTLVPCPVITAHPNGFVERTEPERETHEVRCVPPHAPSVFPDNGTSRGSTRARRRARPARRIAPRDEKTSRVTFPVDARARGSTRTPRYAARADRASPHPPYRTVSPPSASRSARARPPKTTPPD